MCSAQHDCKRTRWQGPSLASRCRRACVVPLLKHGLRIFSGDLRIRTCERSRLRAQVRKFLLQAGPNFRIDVKSEKITSVLHSLAAALLESLAYAGARRKEQPTNPRKEARSQEPSESQSQVHSIYTKLEPAQTVSSPTKLSLRLTT